MSGQLFCLAFPSVVLPGEERTTLDTRLSFIIFFCAQFKFAGLFAGQVTPRGSGPPVHPNRPAEFLSCQHLTQPDPGYCEKIPTRPLIILTPPDPTRVRPMKSPADLFPLCISDSIRSLFCFSGEDRSRTSASCGENCSSAILTS